MSPTTVVVSGAGTAVELSAVAVMLQSREGGQKKLVKKVTPWLPYMGVAQTNLPIEAMLKFEFVSIMTPSNTGLGSMFLVIGGGPFRKFPNPKEQIRHLDSTCTAVSFKKLSFRKKTNSIQIFERFALQ